MIGQEYAGRGVLAYQEQIGKISTGKLGKLAIFPVFSLGLVSLASKLYNFCKHLKIG